MLQKLHIRNYAIIDEIEINFSRRLNIITGETGAGKSILMGALNLILGERADSSALMTTDQKCFIEGFFSVRDKHAVKAFLNSQEFDMDDELVLRREIAATGKSRAFINDSPATLNQLKQLASILVDLHQQFDTLELGDADFQREVLDALGGNTALLATYKLAFDAWQSELKALQQLREKKTNFSKEQDYFQFLFDELNDAGLVENELEDLDAELQLLSNAEAVKLALSKVYYEIKDNEQPVLQLIKQLINQLTAFEAYNTGIATLAGRLKSVQIELQDIASEAEHLDNTIQYDEKRIDKVNEKIATGYKLLKKHGVKTTQELLAIQHTLEEKLEAVLHIDNDILDKENKVAALHTKVTDLAENISVKRKAAEAPLVKKVNMLLIQVGMPNAKLKIDIKEIPLSASGKDGIEFLFDANKSNRFEPLRKVASGGELSRLMLCIKSLVAESVDLPTLIFDEIDTGISGEAARQVGIIMKQLAASRQVISITHQPQIAGKADAHFFVYKEIKGNAVKTNIRLLDNNERITAIAKMLSGEKPTAAALENAKEMMN